MDSQKPQAKIDFSGSWDSITLRSLIAFCGIPILIVAAILSVLSIWHTKNPDSISNLVYIIIFVIVCVGLAKGFAYYTYKRALVTKQSMNVVAGFTGLIAGLITGAVKLIFFFHIWALFRLISEPIILAIVFAAAGFIVYSFMHRRATV